MKHRRIAVTSLVVYVVLATITPVSQVLGLNWLTTIAYVALMPLLLVFARATLPRGTQIGTLLLVALVLSWFGDWADRVLLFKIAFFFLAQVAYLGAFWPYRRASLLVRPVRLAGFAVVLGVLTLVIAAHAGSLAVPVTIYGAAITLMAVLATGVNRIVSVGAFLFLASDIVLAVHLFIGPEVIPLGLALNSALYLPGQLLLTLGVVLHARTTRGVPLRGLVSSRR